MSLGSSPMHAPVRTDAPGPETAARHYRVFISYSHADTKWANWLMGKLEGYRVSRRFHGRRAPVGVVGARLAPVFRDRDELPTTSDLGETIRNALRESETLVVICSPRSAKSRWVQEEIKAFKRLHGERKVFAFIVDGEPKHEGADDDCFSIALRRELGGDGELSDQVAEVVAADAREQGDGPKLAFLRLVAGLLGVGFDDLRQRELQRRNRRLTLIAAASAVGMTITAGLAVVAWRARNDAVVARVDAERRKTQAEDLLGFMLVDMRVQLEKAGRLELLESVGIKARTYVDSLDGRDLTDATLSGKVKALIVIGVVQSQKLQMTDALRTFEQARALAEAITIRHPGDGSALFDRAQAEYWIANVFYGRRDIAQAWPWAKRYRDSSGALAALEPGNPRSQREAVSGHHNLAVIALERGDLVEARTGFLAELPLLERMLSAEPKNLELSASIANIESYLGTVAERGGDLLEANNRFTAQTDRIAVLAKAEPRTARWQQLLANASALRANVLAITGQQAAAMALRQQALRLLAPLLAADPENANYRRAALKIRLQVALLLQAEGSHDAAQRILDELRPEYESLAKLAPNDRRVVGSLAVVWRVASELESARDSAGGLESATRSIALLEQLLAKAPDDEELAGDFFNACVVAGQIARARGDLPAARAYWKQVTDGFGTRWRVSRNWRLLDPAARAFGYLRQTEDAWTLRHRLDSAGYQPLVPWPTELRSTP